MNITSYVGPKQAENLIENSGLSFSALRNEAIEESLAAFVVGNIEKNSGQSDITL